MALMGDSTMESQTAPEDCPWECGGALSCIALGAVRESTNFGKVSIRKNFKDQVRLLYKVVNSLPRGGMCIK